MLTKQICNEEEQLEKSMTSSIFLKWTIFKTDIERLRYLALYDIWHNAFLHNYQEIESEDEFLYFSDMWLNKIKESKVWEQSILNWGIDVIYRDWFKCKLETNYLKHKVKKTIRRIKSGELIDDTDF